MNVCLCFDISVHSAAPALASSCLRARKKLLAWGSGISASPHCDSKCHQSAVSYQNLPWHAQVVALRCSRGRWGTSVKMVQRCGAAFFKDKTVHNPNFFRCLPSQSPWFTPPHHHLTQPSSLHGLMPLPPSPRSDPVRGIMLWKITAKRHFYCIHSRYGGEGPPAARQPVAWQLPKQPPLSEKVGACECSTVIKTWQLLYLGLSCLSEVGDACLHLWEQHNDSQQLGPFGEKSLIQTNRGGAVGFWPQCSITPVGWLPVCLRTDFRI